MNVYCKDCHEAGEPFEQHWHDPMKNESGFYDCCGFCGSENITPADELADEAEYRFSDEEQKIRNHNTI